jgi:FkbM family methyltransferase
MAYPNAEIHAFEPFPDSHRELTTRVAARPRIHPHCVAVLVASGKARLNVNARSSTNSVFETSAEAARFVAADLMKRKTTLEVDAVSLDAFCQDEGIEHVDVLKIDVQGAELLVFQGARALLEEARIDLVYAEVLFAPLYNGQAGFSELHEHMTRLGYRLYGLFDLNYGKNEMLAWADAIWLSPERADGLAHRGS